MRSLIYFVLVGVAACDSGPQELVVNGDFEIKPTADTGPVPGWNIINGEAVVDSAMPLHGAASLRMTAVYGTPPDWWGNQSIATADLEPGRRYRLSAWLMTPDDAWVAVWLYGDPTYEISGELAIHGPGDWQYVESIFEVPAGQESYRLVFDVTPGNGVTSDVTGWFDDISLQPE
jgi:hypothetical protein